MEARRNEFQEFSLVAMVVAAMRVLAYGCLADAIDVYVRIGRIQFWRP
jgi:hypothetical protein